MPDGEEKGRQDHSSQSTGSSSPFAKPASIIFAPILIPLKFLVRILPWIIVILIVIVGGLYIYGKSVTGQLGSTVEHAEVAGEEALSPANRFLKKNMPGLYLALNPSAAKTYNPYAIDSAVETYADNRDIGVSITEFKPITDFFRPNSDIRLIGKIKARGLDQPADIEVFCKLDDYHNGTLVLAELLGTTASGNRGTIFKDQTTEFIANCVFPGGVQVDRQVTSKIATLVVTYEFETKAYQRLWVLDRNILLDLESNGINPFTHYARTDPLLGSDRKVRSKTTPGPINLGLQIDFPQPITQGSKYLLMVQLSRTLEAGNLDQLQHLRIQVPSVNDLDLVLASEQDLGAGSTCDFEYVTDTGDGYKEYQLLASKVQEVNTKCEIKSIRDFLGLSEADCTSLFKEPVFTCNFAATRVPSSLQSDIIKADTLYTFKVEKRRAVDIKALPGELAVA